VRIPQVALEASGRFNPQYSLRGLAPGPLCTSAAVLVQRSLQINLVHLHARICFTPAGNDTVPTLAWRGGGVCIYTRPRFRSNMVRLHRKSPVIVGDGSSGSEGTAELISICNNECYLRKAKAFPHSLPSVGPGADPNVQAVSPQVTISHLPGGRLSLLAARPAVTSVTFIRWRQTYIRYTTTTRLSTQKG